MAATRRAILGAARELLVATGAASIQDVAAKAGVSRITVYNQFGSKAGLIGALVPHPDHPIPNREAAAREQLRLRIFAACSAWAADPLLFRHLSPVHPDESELDRLLAGRLAAADELRPGCSIKEAQDVIGALTSFPVFDRLYKDARRSTSAVAEILVRLASGILA